MPEFRQLGLVSYEQAWKLQLDLVSDRAEGRVGDTILLAEHFPVFTLGRKTPGVREAVAQPTEIEGVPVFPVERGGEATFHGPGQAVLYPIFHLDLLRSGPRKFLRMLEESIVTVVQSYGLDAFWLEGKTGVWLLDSRGRERKLASLGIAVRRSVSYHGLALNVNTDLSYFRLIQPCGFAPDVMTSLAAQLGRELPLEEVQNRLAAEVAERFEKLRGSA
jgi:lipoyl(octanoyl) transferase